MTLTQWRLHSRLTLHLSFSCRSCSEQWAAASWTAVTRPIPPNPPMEPPPRTSRLVSPIILLFLLAVILAEPPILSQIILLFLRTVILAKSPTLSPVILLFLLAVILAKSPTVLCSSVWSYLGTVFPMSMFMLKDNYFLPFLQSHRRPVSEIQQK